LAKAEERLTLTGWGLARVLARPTRWRSVKVMHSAMLRRSDLVKYLATAKRSAMWRRSDLVKYLAKAKRSDLQKRSQTVTESVRAWRSG
jgi:hypothetical protein